MFGLVNEYLSTVDESQRAQSKLVFGSMYKTLCAAYMSDSAPTSLSPTTVKQMQLLAIFNRNKCAAAAALCPPCARTPALPCCRRQEPRRQVGYRAQAEEP